MRLILWRRVTCNVQWVLLYMISNRLNFVYTNHLPRPTCLGVDHQHHVVVVVHEEVGGRHGPSHRQPAPVAPEVVVLLDVDSGVPLRQLALHVHAELVGDAGPSVSVG